MSLFKTVAILVILFLSLAGCLVINERAFIAHKADDYQREILISLKLLSEYAFSCNEKKFGNFLAYAEHSVSAYERKVKDLEIPLYFFDDDLMNQHKRFVGKYYSELNTATATIDNCKRT